MFPRLNPGVPAHLSLSDIAFQDNFQKLMHIQYSLNGHHEIVQPGRVSQSGPVKSHLNPSSDRG